jgi:hypothetical protein
MRAVHEAQNVAEGIDDRGDDEATEIAERLIWLGAYRQQPLDGGGNIIDVPVNHGAGWACRRWCIAAKLADES